MNLSPDLHVLFSFPVSAPGKSRDNLMPISALCGAVPVKQMAAVVLREHKQGRRTTFLLSEVFRRGH